MSDNDFARPPFNEKKTERTSRMPRNQMNRFDSENENEKHHAKSAVPEAFVTIVSAVFLYFQWVRVSAFERISSFLSFSLSMIFWISNGEDRWKLRKTHIRCMCVCDRTRPWTLNQFNEQRTASVLIKWASNDIRDMFLRKKRGFRTRMRAEKSIIRCPRNIFPNKLHEFVYLHFLAVPSDEFIHVSESNVVFLLVRFPSAMCSLNVNAFRKTQSSNIQATAHSSHTHRFNEKKETLKTKKKTQVVALASIGSCVGDVAVVNAA